MNWSSYSVFRRISQFRIYYYISFLRLVIKILDSKEEALSKVQCVKIACFCFIFEVLYFGLPKQTAFQLCMEYINEVLNNVHVKSAFESVVYKSDSQIRAIFFSAEIEQKQMIHDNVKCLISTVIKFLQPSNRNDPIYNYLGLFIGSDESHLLGT